MDDGFDLYHPHLCNCGRSSANCQSHQNHRKKRGAAAPLLFPTIVLSNRTHRRARSIAYSPLSPPPPLVKPGKPGEPPCLRRLPIQIRIFNHQAATIIQRVWRGYRGQLLSEIRKWQLSQLTKNSRSTYFYVEQKRLQQCLLEWQQVASRPRLERAATIIEALRRGHAARQYVRHVHMVMERLLQIANQRRICHIFSSWRYQTKTLLRRRRMRTTCSRWRETSRRRGVCRRTLRLMSNEKRGNELQAALRKLYAAMLFRRRLEVHARTSVTMYRWIRFTDEKIKHKLRTIKKTIVYWRAWTCLQKWRDRRRAAVTRVQARYRGYNIRIAAFRAARLIQCSMRQRLARNKWRRARVWALHVEIFQKWSRGTPMWRIARIKAEKRRLYRAAVVRRHKRRARKGKASPMSRAVRDEENEEKERIGRTVPKMTRFV